MFYLPISITQIKAAFFVGAACILMTTPVYAQEIMTLSLEEAHKLALENNVNIKNANLDIRRAKKQIAQAVGEGLLDINTKVDYGYSPLLPAFVLNTGNLIPGATGEQEVSTGTKNNLIVGATATLTLFSGPYIVGVQAAKAYEKLVAAQKTSSEYDIKDAVNQAYYSALAAEENLRLMRDSQEKTNKIVADLEAMYAVDYIEETDVDRIRVNQVRIDNTVYALEQQVKITYKLLNYQLGLPLHTPIKLSQTLEEFAKDESEYLQLLRKDYDVTQNIRYEIAKRNVYLNYKNTQIAYFRLMPSIALYGNAQYQSQRDSFSEIFNKKGITSATVGLRISIPIFKSFANLSSAQMTKVDYLKAKVALEDTEQKLSLEMDNLTTEYLSNYAGVQATLKNKSLNEKIYDKSEIKFKNAKMNSQDFATTQLNTIQSQQDYIQALLTLLNTKSKIQQLLAQQQK